MRARRVVGAVAVAAGIGVATAAYAQSDEARPSLDTAASSPALDVDAYSPDLDLDASIEDISGDVRVDAGDETIDLDLDADVLFAFGSAELTADADDTLGRALDEIVTLGAARGDIIIVGHTDAIGSEADNQLLSESRAQAVRERLEAELGSAFDYVVEGRGQTEPVAPNVQADGSDNEPGRALNRRVEVTFETR